MRWLLLLARVAFICNLFFIATIALRFTRLPLPQGITGFIIITGFPLSFTLNVLFNVTVLVLVVLKRTAGLQPRLTLFNLLCFLFQIAYFLIV